MSRTRSTLCLSLLTACSLLSANAHAELYVSIIQGLGGEAQYQQQFDEQRDSISRASNTITVEDHVSIFAGDDARRDSLLSHFKSLASSMNDDDRALIYLIGHGSFDGIDYKFNLPGADITGAEFQDILQSLPGNNHLLLNTSSTSGAMLELITADDEQAGGNIVISATRNGNERNATHFGRYFAQALTSNDADLNKNNLVSVQEAYDFAVRSVDLYFEEAQRLATEHAQLRGSGADRLSLSRLDDLAAVISSDDTDPRLRILLTERQQLDAEIEDLQLQRSRMTNIEYLQQLQALILQSAELTELIDTLQDSDAAIE